MYVNNLGDGYDYAYRYDEMGRFEKIFYHGAGNPWVQYHYDNASNETQRDNLLNHVNQIYDPDELNRPRKVELQHDGTPFAREVYDYWPIGRLHTVTRANNRQDQFGYYLDGELYFVFYDVTAAEAPDPNEMPLAEDPAKEKTVDDLLALPDGMGPDGLDTAARTVTYVYDKAGNRTAVGDTVNGTAYYTPNNLNQYQSINNGSDPITNGPEHEIASYKNASYTYMKDEHLTRVTSGTSTYDLAYDALGRCVKRTVRTQMVGIQQPDVTPRPRPTPYPRPSPPPPSPSPSPTPPGQVEVTKYYIYDGERPILEYDQSGALAGYNLYGKGVDEILMRFDPTGPDPQPFYYQQDHEGSITHLTYNPPTGQTPILEYYRYDVFGAPKIYGPPPNWSQRTASLYSNRFLFTGREWAAMFGFYEYRARAYHPGLGRFMSEDPKLFDTGDYNLFRYCHNDPIDLTDPMGTETNMVGRLENPSASFALWEMTKWFDRSNIIQGNFPGFGFTLALTDREAKGDQSERGMHTYSLKPNYSIGNLSGARGYQYVWDPNENYSGQCLTTVQHLSGAPSSSTPLIRGNPVGPNTKPGTAIATGYRYVNERWIYPSKAPSAFKADERINHATFYVAPLGNGMMQMLEAQRGIALHLSRPQPMEGWYEITSRLPPSATSSSQLRPAGGLYGPFY